MDAGDFLKAIDAISDVLFTVSLASCLILTSLLLGARYWYDG